MSLPWRRQAGEVRASRRRSRHSLIGVACAASRRRKAARRPSEGRSDRLRAETRLLPRSVEKLVRPTAAARAAERAGVVVLPRDHPELAAAQAPVDPPDAHAEHEVARRDAAREDHARSEPEELWQGGD